MRKDDVLQVRVGADDMACLKAAASRRGVSVSDYVRGVLEPSIVAQKIADTATDFDFVDSVTLFGSMARGEQTDESDIDIAVAMSRPARWMGDRGIGRFIGRLEEATGRGVDFVKLESCHGALAADIAQDGRVVYER